ncbi:MAG: ferric reductase-like transmembrane domain-containing protein [Gammaproteobacteria bacterium]
MSILSGWLALILLVASFYLSIRLPLLNWIFSGLKRQLHWHHLIALLSVISMVLHLAQVIWSFRYHFELLFDWRDVALLSGWITFLGVVLAMPFAFYRVQIPYRRWRFIHLLVFVCLITALIHTFLLFEPSTYSEWIIFALVVSLGIIALLLAVILPGFSFWGKKYLITRITEVRPKLFLLQLQPYSNQEASQHFQFDPGQFIYLKFTYHDFSGLWHPFTIVSKPSDPYIELFIKARGRDTNRLDDILLPSPVQILAPFGTLFWKLDENQLWIAYGVGAAIFLAAIRSFPPSFRKKIHFICCDSSANNMFFGDELDDCMRSNANFSWEPYIGTGI